MNTNVTLKVKKITPKASELRVGDYFQDISEGGDNCVYLLSGASGAYQLSDVVTGVPYAGFAHTMLGAFDGDFPFFNKASSITITITI